MKFNLLADITISTFDGPKRITTLLDTSEDAMNITLGGYVTGDPNTHESGGYIRMSDILIWHSSENVDIEYTVRSADNDYFASDVKDGDDWNDDDEDI